MDTNKIMEAVAMAIRSRDVTLQNVQGTFQKPFIVEGYKVRGQDVILCDINAYYSIQEVTCIADTSLGKVTLRGTPDGWECDIGGGEFVPYSGDKKWSDKCTLGHDDIIFDLVYEYLFGVAHNHVIGLWDELDAKYGVDNIYIADAERGTEIYLACGFVDFEELHGYNIVHYTISDDELAGYLLNWGFEDTIIINSGLPDFAVDLKVAIGGKENIRLHKKLSRR